MSAVKPAAAVTGGGGGGPGEGNIALVTMLLASMSASVRPANTTASSATP
jgi:hypothetical protein